MKKSCKKVRRKGFTLVEILGVIVVIGLLTILIAPNIINQLNKHKEEVAEIQRKSLSDSADEYFTKTDINYGKISNKTYCVSLKTLQENNYVESDLVNALTGKKYDVEKTYIVGKAGNNPNSIEYTVNENGSCGDTFTICTISKSLDNKISYTGKNGAIVSQEQFLNECKFEDGIVVTSSPTGWAKQKEVKIVYNGNLVNPNYEFDGENITSTKINDNLTIVTGIIKKNQTITGTANRILETNQLAPVIGTYKEEKIDNTKPTCKFTYDGMYDKDTNWFGDYPTLHLVGTDTQSPLSRIYIKHNNKKNPDKKNTKKLQDTISLKINEDTKNGGSYSGYVADSAGNTQTCESYSPIRIDTKDPSLNLKITKTTTRSITVKAEANAVSDIKTYEYSINNGSWQSSKNNTYTFDQLTHNTNYTINVRVTSNAKRTTEDTIEGKTYEIETPSCSTSKNVITISYPSGCSSLTCTYNKDNKNNNASDGEKVTFSDNGYLVAKASDGYNNITNSCNYDKYRNIVKKSVRGGDITLSTTRQYIGGKVSYTKSPSDGFFYQGATLVYNKTSDIGANASSFTVPETNSGVIINVYPTWKHYDYVWAKRHIKGDFTGDFVLTGYDSVNTPGQFYPVLRSDNEDGIYIRTGIYTADDQGDFNGVKYQGDDMKKIDSRNYYSSTEQVPLTDYKTWVTTFDCYKFNDNFKNNAEPYNVTNDKNTNGIAIFRTVSNTKGDKSETNNSSYCKTTYGGNNYKNNGQEKKVKSICGHAEIPLDNYKDSYYMNIQILAHVKQWCGWMDNYLLGQTYSYKRQN